MPESVGKGPRDFSEFDKMDTEELKALILLDQENEGQSDVDAILYIARTIAKREEENPEGTCFDLLEKWDLFLEQYCSGEDDLFTAELGFGNLTDPAMAKFCPCPETPEP